MFDPSGMRAGIEIAMVATDMQQILRTGRNIRDDQGENYFLILQYSGRALMAQNERAAMLLPGDLVCNAVGFVGESDHRQILRSFANMLIWGAVGVGIALAAMQ